jgi:glycosyltransferase involved in cell wall biosynthesis
MKVLMSAFACCPGVGSEQGVGWNWAIETGKLGHKVTVLTQTQKAPDIEAARAKGLVPENVTFDYFMPGWLQHLYDLGLKTGFHGITRQIIHLLWQIAAYFHVRARHRDQGYDIIHHITYGGIRHPTLLGSIGIPLVLGPVGGGERAPFALRRSFSWRGWLTDLARDIHTFALRFDPITRSACKNALAIYVITEQSKNALPKQFHHKIDVRMEIGLHEIERARKRRAHDRPLRLIYAGRMLYWKGMALGLRALSQARDRGCDVRLTMVGSGPEEPALRRLADELELDQTVNWAGWVPHEKLTEVYRDHDALLFPSLHDSSGNVVLEAFAEGLPVICLKLDGPAEMVTERSGRAVAVDQRDEAECVVGLSDAIVELAGSPDLLDELSKGARECAGAFSWADVVAGLYGDVERRLAEHNRATEAHKGAMLQAGGLGQ